MAGTQPNSGFKPLPEEEVAICRRLGRARKLEGLTQADLSSRLGVSLNTLVAVENSRVALKWPLGVAVCGCLNISQLWLAFGTDPIRPYFDVDPGFVGLDAPFSGVVTQIKHSLEARLSLVSIGSAASRSQNARQLLVFKEEVEREIRKWAERVLPGDHYAVLNMLPDHLNKLLFRIQTSHVDPEEKTRKQGIDNVSANANIPAVKSPLGLLLERLNRATAARGVKSQLAKELGVPLPCVSQWLSGEREPGGETTLKLLKWVEQQERK